MAAAGLAELLSPQFTVYTWDRRGRGDSSDTTPYSVQREIEDLGALVAAAGRPCCVYGHSSGGALALEAAQQGLPMAGLAAYEPPYMVEGEPDDDFNGLVSRAVEEGRPEEALALFIGNAMPGSLDDMKQSPFWPSLVKLAPTLPYDLAIVRDGSIPLGRFAAIDTPTLLLVGGTSPSWAGAAAEAIVASVPGAVRRTVEGQDHRAANEVRRSDLGPVLWCVAAGHRRQPGVTGRLGRGLRRVVSSLTVPDAELQYFRGMNVSRSLRRWCVPVLGVVFLAFGLLVFLTQSTLTASWTVYDLAAGTALAPGAPTLQFGQVGEGYPHQVRQLSLSGQLSIAVGIALMAGWIGFALGKRKKAHASSGVVPFSEAMLSD